MAENLTTEVNFNIIRYANCWEDADILLQGLQPKAGDRILSIASAGDNSFSFLAYDPELVVAVDVSPIQVYLVELKKICFCEFTHPEFLKFLGFTNCRNRINNYREKLRVHLSPEAAGFWDNNLEIIKTGIIYSGKFEKYFTLFRTRILRYIHTEKRIEKLFREKSPREQEEFYFKKWNNLRWRLLFRIFFSRFVMGRLGRDPQFLKEVDVVVSDFIYKKAQDHLKSINCQKNYFLNFILRGNFGDLLPHFARVENFELIKKNIDKLEIYQGYAQDAMAKYGNFHLMNLSNIFEYMNPELFKNTTNDLLNGLNVDGKMAYWNLMVPRSIAKTFPDRVIQVDTSALGPLDKGFFYRQFITDKKIG